MEAGVIAALYAALTYISSALGAAYLGIQFRASEALCILPLFTPAAIPGLVIGCALGNLGSPFALYDIVFGTLATLLAAMLTRYLGGFVIKGFPVFSFLPPVLLNAVIVGAEIALLADTGFSLPLFALSAAQVAAGEAAVLTVLGIPLYLVVKKRNIL